MATPHSEPQKAQIAADTRQRFLAEATQLLDELTQAVGQRLTDLMNEAAALRERQSRRDAWAAYQRVRQAWVEGVRQHWQGKLSPTRVDIPVRDFKDTGLGLELLSTAVVENKILVSRLAQGITEKAGSALNDLRFRMRHLEGTQDDSDDDILRPEITLQALVEQWNACGMPSDAWAMVHDVVRQLLEDRYKRIYAHCNEQLVAQGVLPHIDQKERFRRTAKPSPVSAQPMHHGAESQAPHTQGQDFVATSPMSVPGTSTFNSLGASPSGWMSQGEGRAFAAHHSANSGGHHVPSSTPQSRGADVIGQLQRLIQGYASDATLPGPDIGPSSALAAAIATPQAQAGVLAMQPALGFEDVTRMAGWLRQQSSELKKKAETIPEKATIEIVALMFESILTEERIPPSIRVWFARLQMPVLRVALSDPDFLRTLDHPARQLIDRMGSCAMGFDQNSITGTALETEIRRVVQVIEQYPESGTRVFKIVYDEFQKFLAKFLTDTGNTPRVVSVAQQVEQKEILTIQYTIEMRNMLREMAVVEDVRNFLFKVWAEVMALSAMRLGPQHENTLALKKSAADLVWSASAKPDREDRARMIRDLPDLMQRLRDGMGQLGMAPAHLEEQLKRLSDIMADAFMAKTEAIPQAQIEAMIERLANLDDFVSEEGLGDLPLDAQSIELMLGIDASTIDVVMDGGSKPSPQMQAWAEQLAVGAWMMLDHNGKRSKVQMIWRSEHKHLNLFMASSGHSYLIQAGRMASYLQAGLLLPQEEEALTVRATREALTKLGANPERLFQTED